MVRHLVAEAGKTEQMYLELTRVQALGPGEQADNKRQAVRQEVTPDRRGLYILAIMGPAWADYGDDRLEGSAATELGLHAGWLWRWNRLGINLDASLLALPVTDGATPTREDHMTPHGFIARRFGYGFAMASATLLLCACGGVVKYRATFKHDFGNAPVLDRVEIVCQ